MKPDVRKVIPALDVTDLDQIERLLDQIAGEEIIYGFKVGFALGLSRGLRDVVKTIRKYSEKPIIYDHQKAATDIPDTGRLFARVMKEGGIDEVILFPQAGPVTLTAWIEAIRQSGLRVIVGGIMTHSKFVESEGGFICDKAVVEMYRLAHLAGVRDFVVPLTRPESTRRVYEQAGLDENSCFYSPGYGKQGGSADAFDFLKTHYIIIGRSLLNAENPSAYLEETTRILTK